MYPAITQTDFNFSGQTSLYRGKVRDVYTIGTDLLVLIATDRISAFDVVLPRAIPYKGQVLSQLSAFFLQATGALVPNWLLAAPDPNACIGWRCQPIAVEMIVRAYLCGHAWRHYRNGHRHLCGVHLPEGLRENDPLPHPIVTPTTKAHVGHDQDVSPEEIVQKGLVSEAQYRLMESYALKLFEYGSTYARSRGLILVDTKYEFGFRNGQLLLIDEVHTPDSSRYFYLDGYEERQAQGLPQRQLSKEFVRQWLIEHNFMGRPGDIVPEMSDEWVQTISKRYVELYEQMTGQTFVPRTDADPMATIYRNISTALANLSR
ncbi:MAG: phosphoribosylaminoimidazolesuccinocarboxamide synthase [Chitinophagales bacterium]|nr:phosphoribosylaminoimidazolesuccinocarboxamide synthase [Chitinophagales bacterium]MDW8428149.1 phosphoribosylaminoimidazolesuccinocarboxamide synthase [Chitinophagales bacterium]